MTDLDGNELFRASAVRDGRFEYIGGIYTSKAVCSEQNRLISAREISESDATVRRVHKWSVGIRHNRKVAF